MLLTAIALTALALVLTGPVAARLASARWVQAEPRAGLVLWQAIGLASGLAVVGALLAVALAPVASSLSSALREMTRRIYHREHLPELDAVHAATLALALALLTWLVAVTLVSVVRTWRSRRCHRVLLDLVATPLDIAGRATPVRLIDHPSAAAYCLPGPHPRVVVTSGAMQLLGDRELAAVLAHEQAHVSEHHDWVTLPFAAAEAALPWLPGARRAKTSVAQLVEMVADDRACERYSRHTLAAALARFGLASASSPAPSGALAAGSAAVLERVRRLLDQPRPAPRVRVVALSCAAALVTVPTALLVLALG